MLRNMEGKMALTNAERQARWRERKAKDQEIIAELKGALEALLEGRPTKEPPEYATMAHRNWKLFERARKAIKKANT